MVRLIDEMLVKFVSLEKLSYQGNDYYEILFNALNEKGEPVKRQSSRRVKKEVIHLFENLKEGDLIKITAEAFVEEKNVKVFDCKSVEQELNNDFFE